ncbi:MAG TPA: carboxypeptidase regulatory-like domain-containing protein [Planctomycetaceae bacterium]|jgi:beta-lactamase regulating signal transducer with metallopeptidase domain/protocatechuate 3,4-dioxygenase beta subunit
MSDLSIQWLIVFVDASVKAALVALVAAAGLSLLRVRDSNLRHRAWMGVLCGMLLLPVLTQVIPTLRLPFSVDPEWFAELQRTGGSQALGTDRSQTSDKSHSDDQPAAETTSTTSEPVSDGQPAPLESESPLNGYDRALAGRPDWPGARGRWPGEFHSGPPQSYGTSDDALTENPSAEPAAVAETKPVEPEAAERSAIAAAVEPSVWKSLMARIPLVFWSVWILGAALLTLRLLAGLWMAQKLRRASRLIDPARLPALVTNANTFAPSRRDVPILECPTIRVPFTLGVFHPRILLPPDWINWSVEKLHVVLIHERTHAERGDCALALLAELNRCLYWFHPLAWWLRRRLASLAEAACDDAAIGTTGDRASYARHLLEVAATARAHRGRLVIGGVSMARCSSVETRIDSILDFRRPLSQRLTRGTALVLVAVIVPLIALAAALRPSTGKEEAPLVVVAEEAQNDVPTETAAESSPEYSVLSTQESAQDNPDSLLPMVDNPDANPPLDPPVDGGKENVPAENGEKKEASSPDGGKPESPSPSTQSPGVGAAEAGKSRSVRGRVVDAAGKPLADVSLQVLKFGPNRVIAAEEADGPLLAQTKTDADGRFALELEEGRRMPLVAEHPGYALDLFDIPERGDVPAAEIVLKPEQPIPGRMIDAEGRPVAGAKVFIGARLSPRQPNLLDEYLEERKKGSPGPPVENRFLTLRFMPTSYLPISDAEGRFVIHGIAADGACQIQINDDRFVRERVVVVNRQGLDTAPYNPPAAGNRQAPVRLVGPDFTHVGIPGLTIEGRATANGKPAADLIVRASANLSVVGVTTTDAEGRYRLTGVPRGREVRMSFGGPERQTEVLRHEVTISTTADDAQKTVDVELKLGSVGEGTLLSGRVIDPLTGNGVPAFVRFVPMLGNEFANQPRYKDALRGARQVRANGGGEFRVPVIPGPGAVMVQVNPTIRIGGHMVSPFRMGVVSKADSAKLKLTERPFGKAFPAAGGGFSSLDLSNIAQYVDLAEGAQAEPIEITLDRGKTAELEIVDGDGQPVTGAVIVGIDDFSFPTRLDESRTTLYALAAESPRKLIVRHSLHGLAGLLTVTGNEPSPIRMMLDKAAAIRGRAVDKSGAPIAETACETFSQATFQLQKFENTGKPQQKTGADGRFRFDNLIPGEPIELRVSVDGKLLTAKLTAEQQPQKPGQEVDLGDVVFAPPNQQLPQPNKQNMAAATPPPLSAENSVLSTQSPAADIPKSSAKSDGTFTFAGSVVDEQGQPVARAKVSVSYFHKNPSAPDALPALLTDERGKFEFSAKNGDFVDGADGGQGFWFDAGLVAVKAGYGFAFRPLVHFETSGRPASELPDRQRDRLAIPPGKKSNVLTLVRDDIPIRGRILNADGQPVAGATIEAFEFWEGKDGTLDAWDAASKKPDADTSTTTPHLRQIARGHTVNFNFRGGMGSAPARRATMHGNVFAGSRPPLIPVVHTGEDGRFTLHGIGRERIAELLISGPGIETSEERVRTRAGETVKLGLDSPVPHASLAFTYHPHEFTLVSGPSIPVTGRVTDFKTGQPLAGVGVESSGQWKGVVTDTDGKYRLEGLPVGVNDLLITPPARSRHLPGGVHLTTTAAAPTVVRDISLTAGVLVRGRAIDETTGKPVRGNLQYFAYKTNPHATESDSLHEGHSQNGIHPDADGRFEIPVLPGQGILALRAGTEFPDGVGADGIDCPRQATGGNSIVFETWPTYCIASAHSLLAPINPRPEDNESTVNLALRSTGSEFQARVFAPDGQPLINYLVFGARRGVVWQRNTRESFNVTAYNPSETRRLIVFHQERNLVGYRDLSGEPPKDLAITLQPAATLVGRVLDADDGNAPFPQVSISDSRYTVFLRGQPSAADLEHGVLQINLKTDSDGRFELKGIVPGLKYSAYLNFRPGFFTERRLKGSRQGPVFSDVTAEPGQTKNLGDLVLKLDSGKPAESVKPTTNEKPPLDPPVDGGKKRVSTENGGKTNSPAANTEKADIRATGNGNVKSSLGTEYSVLSTQSSRTVRGRVVDAAGKPIAGVALSVPVMTDKQPQLQNEWKLNPKATTDAEGRFAAEILESDFPAWREISLIAQHRDYGVEWFNISNQGEIPQAEIVLYPEQVIRGRMIDAEARPVAGAKIAIRSLLAPETGNSLDAILAERQKQTFGGRTGARHAAGGLPDSFGAVSDDEGRIVLHGVAAERLCAIEISAGDFATTTVLVANRQGLDAVPYNQPRRDVFGGRAPDLLVGPEFTHVGVPGLTIEGRVTAAGGKPVADLTVGASPMGTTFTRTATDADGRYRLSGLPRGRQLSVRFAMSGHGDLLPSMVRLSPNGDEGLKTVDIELKNGIVVSGRVVDPLTGGGVRGAITFLPLPGNEFVQKPGYEGSNSGGIIGYADDEGHFRFAAMPGRGVLAVEANSRIESGPIFRCGAISDEDVPQIKPQDSQFGGRYFATAIGQMGLMRYHLVKYVNFSEDGGPYSVDLKLDRGKSVDLEFVDDVGQPVTGLAVSGLADGQGFQARQVTEASTTIFALGSDRPRQVIALHPDRGLAGSVTLTGEEASPVRLTLGKSAAIWGRAVDESGDPIGSAEFGLQVLQEFQRFLNTGKPAPATDKDGRFRITNLVPGEPFHLILRLDGKPLNAKLTKEQQTLKPGQDLDLDDVVFVPQGRQLPQQNEAGKPATKPPLSTQSSRTIRGRVVDPDGKPFAGARIWVVGWYGGISTGVKNVPVAEATSRADGSFEIEFSRVKLELAAWGLSLSDSMTTIVAFGDNFGPVWKRLDELPSEEDVMLELARDDLPVTGRILDPEGRPVRNVKIAVSNLRAPKDGDLSGFLKAVAGGQIRPMAIYDWMTFLPDFDGIPLPAAITDDQGRFRLAGVGRERYAEFSITAPNVAYGEGSIVTRPGASTVMQEMDQRAPNAAKLARRLYGAEIEFVALPSRPVTGTVRDAETGKPMPGIRIFNWRFAGSPLFGSIVIDTFTDKDGRFQLSGMPLGEGNLIMIVPPTDQPYFSRQATVAVDAKLDPVPLEIGLHRGIWITGRVADKATGQPVSAVVHWTPYRTNEFAQKLTAEFGPSGMRTGWTNYRVDPDGTYRVLGLPGRALVAASVNSPHAQSYRLGTGREKLDPADRGGLIPGRMGPAGMLPQTVWRAQPGSMRMYHSLKEINVPESAESFTCDVELDPGESLRVSVVDREGQPLSGFSVRGNRRLPADEPTRTQGSSFDVPTMGPGDKRILLIHHVEKQLGKVATVEFQPDGPREMKITLEPCSTVTGRIVAPAVDPKTGGKLVLMARLDGLDGTRRQLGKCDLDKEGRFRFDGLLLGCEYLLLFEGIVERVATPFEQYRSGPFDVEPGETKDLGDVRLTTGNPGTADPGTRPPAAPTILQSPQRAADKGTETPRSDKAASPPEPRQARSDRPTPLPDGRGSAVAARGSAGPSPPSPAADKSKSTANSEGTITAIHGHIIGPDGKPAVKANVAIIGSRIQPERGGDLSSRSHVLAEVTTHDGGRFEIKLADVSSKAYSRAHIIARSEGSGLAWRRLDPDAHDVDVALELPAEQVIRARFIDIEGQPAGGVRVSIGSVISRSAAEARSEAAESVGYQKLEKPPQAWPPLVTADPQGAFEIRGIPADHGVYLDVEGTDRIAPQWISINTGFSEERSTNDGTYRSLVRNFKPGEEAVLPLAPAQLFEGVVRFEDTGEPAPHARLTIWASQQQFGGSMISLAGKADARGRYRINPLPGVRFGITAYPPDGVPYLIREIRDIRHRDGALVKQVDVSLPRGVLVRGRVVESGTTNPIAGVAVQYVPETRNNPNVADDIVTGWQGIQLSGMDGAFEIAVLPGPGTLLANGPGKQFVSHEFGSRQLERGLPGGERNYAHAMQRINPKPNSDPLDLTLTLHRGVTISGRITNSADEPVEKALLISRLNIHSSELTWRGFPIEALGGRFELSGLGESREYPVHFLDPKNRLGATVVFKAGDQSPTVVLEPCGEAVATFADSLGKPIPDVQPDFEFVVAPGPHRFGSSAMRLVALAADAEYVVNIDRTNYREGPKSDAEGRITFPALIPGGRYRIVTHNDGKVVVRKEFVAESGKTLDLGKIIVAPQKDE